MKILLVIDQFDNGNNGTTISAQRFAQTLKRHGNDVRVVSTGAAAEGKYAVDEWHVPFFDGLVKAQGMTFARRSKATLHSAIEWADIVHFLLPFAISIEGEKIAREMNKARTAAFHLQPENITSSIGMGHLEVVNRALYKGFRRVFYNRFSHIHCPSEFIAGQLRQYGYTAKLHVISNGVDDDFVYRKLPKTSQLKGKFVILMIGRLSAEKRQDVLIDAVNLSRYRDQIQLVLAGQGPKKEALIKRGAKLCNPPIFGFYSKEDLLHLLAMSDLYVHAADVEIEAISCIEALASGLVPVIANSPKSATPQFALDERSLFEAGNPVDLARKIDAWIEQEEERKRMEHQYAEYGRQYGIDRCVSQIEEMFHQAIKENESGQ